MSNEPEVEIVPFLLHHGDCIEVMRGMADNSVDSVVCDPPYELGFMGKSWDASGIAYNVDMWREALRVLKPGGHLLAFSGSRTYHRMTCAIEDAGFEIRDQIMWVYGSGFPKSLDVSKAIDKAAGAEREIVGRKTGRGASPVADLRGGALVGDKGRIDCSAITAPTTDAAGQWEGWGTALKPAHEPICVARKPLIGTVAANVLAFDTGALNIDACRVEPTGESRQREGESSQERRYTETGGTNFAAKPGVRGGAPAGRWPANLIHDGSAGVVALFPESTSGAMKAGTQRSAQDGPGSVCYGTYGGNATSIEIEASSGSAARFFYCAKASRADRNEGLDDPGPQFKRGSTLRDAENLAGARRGNHHPTVKPTNLMAYLCRLVTPLGGLVLDPFMGSGSTGKACMREGFRFVGIDMTAEYVEIARARIGHEMEKVKAAAEVQPTPQLDLFSEPIIS